MTKHAFQACHIRGVLALLCMAGLMELTAVAGQGYLSYLGPAPLRIATPVPPQKAMQLEIIAPPPAEQASKEANLPADSPSAGALGVSGTNKPNGVARQSAVSPAQSRRTVASTNSASGETLESRPPIASSATLAAASDAQTNRVELAPQDPLKEDSAGSQAPQSGSDSSKVSPEMLAEFLESHAGPTSYAPGGFPPVEFIPPAPMVPVPSRATYERR